MTFRLRVVVPDEDSDEVMVIAVYYEITVKVNPIFHKLSYHRFTSFIKIDL